jgi:hypothetical protein
LINLLFYEAFYISEFFNYFKMKRILLFLLMVSAAYAVDVEISDVAVNGESFTITYRLANITEDVMWGVEQPVPLGWKVDGEDVEIIKYYQLNAGVAAFTLTTTTSGLYEFSGGTYLIKTIGKDDIIFGNLSSFTINVEINETPELIGIEELVETEETEEIEEEIVEEVEETEEVIEEAEETEEIAEEEAQETEEVAEETEEAVEEVEEAVEEAQETEVTVEESVELSQAPIDLRMLLIGGGIALLVAILIGGYILTRPKEGTEGEYY